MSVRNPLIMVVTLPTISYHLVSITHMTISTWYFD